MRRRRRRLQCERGHDDPRDGPVTMRTMRRLVCGMGMAVAIATAACIEPRCASCPSVSTITTTILPPSGSAGTTTTIPVSAGFTVSGTIRNEATNAPLGGIEAEVLNGATAGRKTLSAANGAYELLGFSSGAFNLRFRGPGFDTVDRSVTIGTSNVALNVTVRPSPIVTTISTTTISTTTSTTSTTTTIPPVPVATYVLAGPCNEFDGCNFDGSGSTGSNLSYAWDFGDATTGSGVTVFHKFSTGHGSTFVVQLTVTDDFKQSANFGMTVKVCPQYQTTPC